VEKCSQKMRAICFILIQLPKVKNHPLSEKSPNLVTLTGTFKRVTKEGNILFSRSWVLKASF
jgi:hypothetical protein